MSNLSPAHYSNLQFSYANTSHAGVLAEIHNEILLENLESIENSSLSQTGFLLKYLTPSDVEEEILSDKEVFVCQKSEEEILGYLVLSAEFPQDLIPEIIFEKDYHQLGLLEENHNYISLVVVSLRHSKKGVGRFLYESLFKLKPNTSFSAFYVLEPVENTRSKVFHEKQSFQQIGIYIKDNFLGIKNYKSCLVFRPN